MKIRELLDNSLLFFRKNPHLGPSLFLFLLGISFLTTNSFSAVSGALFGAGASLLGAWISDFNTRKKDSESKIQKEKDAVKYLTPELLRTIDRVIYIQNRAIINYSKNARDWHKKGLPGLPFDEKIHEQVNLGDQKEDFIPYLPLLYPNAAQFKDLNGEMAIKLVVYYDSLFELEMNTKDWWKRLGQLPANIFGQISHLSEKSLKRALECLVEFDLESIVTGSPLLGTISERIKTSLEKADQIRAHCYADFEKAKAKKENSSLK
jgi:hypothetical protein